jgi:uncharacterized membrane protein
VSDSIQMSVGFYKDPEEARLILDTLESMHKAATIDLVDMAMLTKADDGKLHVAETRELTAAKGSLRGAIVMGVVGLIYPPSLIASVLAGGGIGAIAGRIRDTGIKKDQIQRVADDLKPGMAAVVALYKTTSHELVDDTLKQLGGELESHVLGAETAADVEAIAQEA